MPRCEKGTYFTVFSVKTQKKKKGAFQEVECVCVSKKKKNG